MATASPSPSASPQNKPATAAPTSAPRLCTPRSAPHAAKPHEAAAAQPQTGCPVARHTCRAPSAPSAIILIATATCFILDCTPIALPLECTLAHGMENALRALLRGLCLPSSLTCTIAPACSGLRIATAAALFALALPQRATYTPPREAASAKPQIVCSVARHICRASIGALAGLWLNLARLLAIELGMRASPALGQTLHDLALPLLIAPLALALCATLPRLTLTARALLATTSALLMVLLLNAPAYIIDWEALP